MRSDFLLSLFFCYGVCVMAAITGENIRGACPACDSEYLVRSHRNAMERLLSMIGFYPYRCDACGKRFILFGKYRGRSLS